MGGGFRSQVGEESPVCMCCVELCVEPESPGEERWR